MNTALIRKELRRLSSLIICFIVVTVFDLVFYLFDQVDVLNWSEFSYAYDTDLAWSSAYVTLVIGVITAYILFPREQTEKTLDFMWGLPINRWSLYIHKVAVATSVLILFIVLGSLTTLLLLSLNSNSTAWRYFSVTEWGFAMISGIAIAFIGLCFGMLASYFKWFGALSLVLILMILSWVGTYYPVYAWVNPSELTSLTYIGHAIQFDTKAWLYHGSTALLALYIGGRLWIRDTEVRQYAFANRYVNKFTLTAFSAVTAFALIGLVYTLVEDDDDDLNQELKITSTTQCCVFSYFESDLGLVLASINNADTIFERVQKNLGVTKSPAAVIDLTDNSDTHAGTARWKKVRINQSELRHPDQFEMVFAHEITHVFSDIESNRRLFSREDSHFFIEGIAEWMEYKVTDRNPTYSRQLAAIAWQRFGLQFKDLMSRDDFGARYDADLAYYIGEVWVSALENSCGSDAPGDLLRSIGEINSSYDLAGVQFWRNRLQHIGCDLSQVNSHFNTLIENTGMRSNSAPAITGSVVSSDESKIQLILVLSDVETGATIDAKRWVYIGYRNSEDDIKEATSYLSAEINANGATVSIPRKNIRGNQFQIQLGIKLPSHEDVFYERWTRINITDE